MPFRAIYLAAARTKIRHRAVCAGLLLAGLAQPGLAQEVITGDYHWHYDPGESATVPAWRKFPAIKYPASFLRTEAIHYVIVLQHIGVRGERTTRATLGEGGSAREAVAKAGSQMRLKKPALRDDEPIEADVWFSVIFNPAGSGGASGDAPIRLLQVSPVPVPWKRGGEKLPRARVRLVVAPDAHVDLVAVEGSTLTTVQRRALEDGVRQWKFSPARQGGQTVYGEIVLPVAFLPIETAVDRDYLPPKLIKSVRPELSPWLRLARPRGEIRVQFAVDETGTVRGATVVQSTNPALNEATLTAVQQWRYQPALRQGKPVRTTVVAPVRFGGGPDENTGLVDDDDPAAGPRAALFDRAPRLPGALGVVYPYELAVKGQGGRARVEITVGVDGRVRESRIERATELEFGRALQAALNAAVFSPATLGTPARPIEATLHITRAFDPVAAPGFGPVSIPDRDKELLAGEDRRPTGPASQEKPDPVELAPGKAPALIRFLKTGGWAEVEFWVDRDGKVRLPRLVSYSHEMAGYAALQELNSWALGERATAVYRRQRIVFPPAETPVK